MITIKILIWISMMITTKILIKILIVLLQEQWRLVVGTCRCVSLEERLRRRRREDSGSKGPWIQVIRDGKSALGFILSASSCTSIACSVGEGGGGSSRDSDSSPLSLCVMTADEGEEGRE